MTVFLLASGLGTQIAMIGIMITIDCRSWPYELVLFVIGLPKAN